MTTHDRDKVIAAAKEAGFGALTPYGESCTEKLYAIAFEAGRQAEREECAQILERQDVDPAFKYRMANAIRARGEVK